MNNKSLSVILPTYNERDNIQPILKEIFQVASDYILEILIVDDNSSDGTVQIIKKLNKYKSIIYCSSWLNLLRKILKRKTDTMPEGRTLHNLP